MPHGTRRTRRQGTGPLRRLGSEGARQRLLTGRDRASSIVGDRRRELAERVCVALSLVSRHANVRGPPCSFGSATKLRSNATQPTPIVSLLEIHPGSPARHQAPDARADLAVGAEHASMTDRYGNTCRRFIAPAGGVPHPLRRRGRGQRRAGRGQHAGARDAGRRTAATMCSATCSAAATARPTI